jgi:lipopolysaccharide transport system permease protein
MMSPALETVSETQPADAPGHGGPTHAASPTEPPLSMIRPPSRWPIPDLRELWRYRDLLWLLAQRNVAALYRMSVLGVAWAVFRPVLMAAIFTLVFGFVLGLNNETDGIPYPLFAFAGLVPWTYFAASLANATNSVVGAQDMLTKVYFPRLVLPIASLAAAVVEVVIQCVILAALMIAYRIAPGPQIALLPACLALATAAALAGGIWLTALNVRYRDVHFILPFLTQALMYLCPIIYPAHQIPAAWRSVYFLNPMAGVVEGFRWSLFGVGAPDWTMFGISSATTLLVLVTGLFYFSRTEQSFADVI